MKKVAVICALAPITLSSAQYSCQEIKDAYQKVLPSEDSCCELSDQTVKTRFIDSDVASQVSWTYWNDFLGDSEGPGERQAILGNFPAEWTLSYPIVKDDLERDSLTGEGEDKLNARRATTVSYSIFDQVYSFLHCRDLPDADKQAQWDYNLYLLSEAGWDTTKYDTQYGDEKCFDRDIAMQQVDAMDLKFKKMSRLGFRIEIPSDKTCTNRELPFLNVYGRAATDMSPGWKNIRSTFGIDSDLGPGTYDIFVDTLNTPPPAWRSQNGGLLKTCSKGDPSGGNIDIADEDHVTKITLGVNSALVTEDAATCAFQLKLIYLNDFTYIMVE